jgi:glycosyltransferase involved in cell wall biosynthesis
MSDTLRFAMVTTFYPPYHFGGDAIGIQRLSRALARRGHAVEVIHNADAWRILSGRADPPEDAPEPGIAVHRLETRNPRWACLVTQQTGRPGLYASRLRELLARGRHDVVNFHNISLAGGPGVLRLGDGVKLYMAHEHWLVCPSHVLWRHGREPCPARQCFRCVLHHRRPPQVWRWTGLLERELRHLDAVIAMSEFSRMKHAEFGFPRPMEVLPYFLPDAADGEPLAGVTPHPRPYFLFVGRLERIKGLQDVIPAFLAGEGPDLVVAGDGEEGPALRAQAAGHPRIRFLGRVASPDLESWYRHALALVVPSICFETFGIILIEAFRAGLPVLARRIGPFPEIVETAGAGLLFEDAASLAAGLARLAGDPALRARLAERGREAFRLHWSESAVVPRYLDLVRALQERRLAGVPR